MVISLEGKEPPPSSTMTTVTELLPNPEDVMALGFRRLILSRLLSPLRSTPLFSTFMSV